MFHYASLGHNHLISEKLLTFNIALLKHLKEEQVWEISSSHGGEYVVQSCLLGYTAEAVRTSETSVDNYFTRQYIPEDNSEHQSVVKVLNLKIHFIVTVCYKDKCNIGLLKIMALVLSMLHT
jgi:hypothetical protein